MIKTVYKIVSLLLAVALVMMPLRLAHAQIPVTHAHDTAMAEQMPGSPAMSGMPCGDMPSSHCGNDHPAKKISDGCHTDAHCCAVLLDSTPEAGPGAPSIPHSPLSVTLTGIIIPAATKPPRNIL